MGPPVSPTGPRRLVLHIGSGKTGTSTIQAYLARNRSALADQGVLYPEAPGRRRHLRLGLAARTDADARTMPSWRRQPEDTPQALRENVRRDLLDEVAQGRPHTIVLSDEALYSLTPEDQVRLRDLVRDLADEVTIVVYLRRQDDHLRSRYQQVVKIGGVTRLVDRLDDPNLEAVYDYRARLEPWRSTFPEADLVVRRFEPRRFPEGSLARDFLQATDLAHLTASLREVEARNESLDAESVEFLRLVNLLRVDLEGAEPGYINNRPAVLRLAAGSNGPVLTLPDDLLDGFMARWEESNRAVAREHFDDGADLFSAERRREGTTTDQRLDPARVGHFLDLAELPREWHAPLVRLAEQENAGG